MQFLGIIIFSCGLVTLILIGGVCLIASFVAIAIPALLVLFGAAIALSYEDDDTLSSHIKVDIGKINDFSKKGD